MPTARRRFARARRCTLALLHASILVVAATATAKPPKQGECPTISAEPLSDTAGEDSSALVLREGMLVDKEGLLALRSLLPKPVWRHRESFFFEGMRLEIGPCHRLYAIPAFYREATSRFAGRSRVDRHGNLRDYTAGLPFPQETIDPADEQAAIKWAWNLEKRFRGPGHRGGFRISNIPGRVGSVQRYQGDFFVFQVAQRADLAATDYRWPGSKDKIWVTGGDFSAPYSARELAWRQFRASKADRRWEQADDIFVYVPAMRKMRRAATPWVDGAYMPKYTAAGQYGGGGVVFGDGGTIDPTAGRNIAASEDARAGLTGLFLRPNAYAWRLLGEQTVLAPINAANPGWPLVADRNYGYGGLSVADDRWDVRHAVVIEGVLKKKPETIHTLTVYLDYQTLQPLYWVTRASKQRLLEIGVLVHRYAGDIPDYPRWPDNTPTAVFEPVAASFVNALEGGGGWLRESYDLRSLPFDDSERKRMTSADSLQHGR